MPMGIFWSQPICGRNIWSPKYRDRALRIRTNSDGMEYMEVNGKPTWTGYPGMPGHWVVWGATNLES